jgi:hypothetical protein
MPHSVTHSPNALTPGAVQQLKGGGCLTTTDPWKVPVRRGAAVGLALLGLTRCCRSGVRRALPSGAQRPSLVLWVGGHGSWVMGHGSWVMGHGSWVMVPVSTALGVSWTCSPRSSGLYYGPAARQPRGDCAGVPCSSLQGHPQDGARPNPARRSATADARDASNPALEISKITRRHTSCISGGGTRCDRSPGGRRSPSRA